MEHRRVLEGLLGLYVALIVVPAGALGAWEAVADGSLIGTLVGAGVAVAVVVALAARTVDSLADRLASLPVAAGVILPPLAYLPYMIFATPPESTAALISLVGLLAILPGFAATLGGTIVRTHRLRAAASDVAVVTVGGDEEEGRNWTRLGGVAVLGVAVLAVSAVMAVTDDADFGTMIPTLTGAWSSLLLFVGNDGSEVAVTDEGLRIDQWFTPWSDLDGYRVTDETVELVRPKWYHPTRDFERGEISDEDALVEALAEFLPRLDEHGRVELDPRR